MVEAIRNACAADNIQCTEYFLQKIIQFHRLLSISSGIIIVGDSFAGKSTIYRILAKAFEALWPGNEPIYRSKSRLFLPFPMKLCFDLNFYISVAVINPKSLSTGKIFGEFDQETHEWHDGVFVINFRSLISAASENQMKWLIVDGPIDSSWTENLNSALDENRRLCLMSGDSIELPQSMNLLFETTDLSHASPATASQIFLVISSSQMLK